MSTKSTYRSLETDDELRARLVATGVVVSWEAGPELEELAWRENQMQRRLLWRTA